MTTKLHTTLVQTGIHLLCALGIVAGYVVCDRLALSNETRTAVTTVLGGAWGRISALLPKS